MRVIVHLIENFLIFITLILSSGIIIFLILVFNGPIHLYLLLLRWCLKEYICTEYDTLTHSTHKIGSSPSRPLLLLLFPLFVLFFFIRCRLTIIISEVDLICEFDSK